MSAYATALLESQHVDVVNEALAQHDRADQLTAQLARANAEKEALVAGLRAVIEKIRHRTGYLSFAQQKQPYLEIMDQLTALLPAKGEGE